MRVAVLALILFFGGGYACIYASRHMDVPSLPHRPDTGNHGQGHSVDAKHCPPGTIPYYLDDPPIFLECMRIS